MSLIRFVCLLLLFLETGFASEPKALDLLVIGDSQTGASWSNSYFGNFFQACLKSPSETPQDFVIYGRAGTEPNDWLGNPAGLDSTETIQRDSDHNQLNIGSGEDVPLYKKRLPEMLETHHPKRVVVFLGDNMLTESTAEISTQFTSFLKVLFAHEIQAKDCFFITPTFQMEVATKRNVPSKNFVNTLKVIQAIKQAIQDKCTVLDGTEIMKKTSYYLDNDTLKRVLIPGLAGCSGASANDNVHICGEAARELANQVCATLR